MIAFEYRNPHFERSNRKTIFTICGMSDYRKTMPRTFGWYSELQNALTSVEKNQGDLREYLYNYIVIEEIPEGVWGIALGEWWFKWNKKKNTFVPIRKPKKTYGTVNWAM